ncbi:hypothetical protein OG955_45230 [Streptomyces sp. NBC_01602]|nr:hypothetical protein OG955_00130 [Streptomyces sp. NBC_01602]
MRCGSGGGRAGFSLDTAAAAELGDGHPAVELGEDAHHLAHGGAHRVFGVVGQDLALIGHERAAAVLPALGQGRLLHHQLAGQTVQVRRHDAVRLLLLDPQQRGGQLGPLVAGDHAGYCLLNEEVRELVAVLAGPAAHDALLVLQPEPVQLAAGGHPDVPRESHRIAVTPKRPYRALSAAR